MGSLAEVTAKLLPPVSCGQQCRQYSENIQVSCGDEPREVPHRCPLNKDLLSQLSATSGFASAKESWQPCPMSSYSQDDNIQ